MNSPPITTCVDKNTMKMMMTNDDYTSDNGKRKIMLELYEQFKYKM